jgi:ankyrin repeat protein
MLPDDFGSMPLSWASSNGHVEVVRLLLESGADIESPNRVGWTPLNAASYKGHFEVVSLLIENGADITIPSNDSWTPLNLASFNGHTGIVKLLLEQGANFEIPNDGGWTPANTACQHGYIEVVNLLLEYGANITNAANDGSTPLCLAASNGHNEMVKLILEKGVDIAVTDKIGEAALHYASENGHAEVARLLLDKGADLTIFSESGITPLHCASYGGHTEVTRLLLERDADLAAKDKVGITPIHYASIKGHAEVTKLLLEEGAKRELATKDEDMLPVSTPKDDHDAPPQYSSNNAGFRDRYGRTPLFYAAGQGHMESVNILISNDASVDATDCYRWTPLFLAVMNEQEEIVKRLITLSRIDANHKDGLGRTLSWWAARSETRGIIKMVHQWASEPCNDVEETIPIKERPKTDAGEFRPCDACMRNMISKIATYTCDLCGYLDICEECFNLGIRCLVSSHELTFNQPHG